MKSYVTPMLSFESFALSSNTATSCGEHINTHSDGKCGLELPGYGVVFLSGVEGCKRGVGDGTRDICYHAPFDSSKLFNS